MRRATDHKSTNLSWDGRSIRWPRYHEGGVPGHDLNLWMCAEDLGLRIWAHFNPLERRPKRGDTEIVRIVDCSDDLRRILSNCLPFNDYGGDLTDVVSGFTRRVAQQFVLRGRIPFEICGGWNSSADPPKLEEAAVVSIPDDSIMQLGQWSFQVAATGAESKESIGRVILLDSSRIVVFTPPRRWQGVLRRIRAGLPIIGRSEHEWRMGFGRHRVPENVKTVNLAYQNQRARLTAPIGWNARGLFSDHITEFYLVARELQWARFCIEIRDAILTTLGEVFLQIGSWRSEGPRLVWDHIPTIQQVEEGEKKIMGEGAHFHEVLKPLRFR